MFPDSLLELVPPRPATPVQSSGLASSRTVELPTDVLRPIFELAVVGDMWTARRLLATAKWVHEWIARDVYTTVYIRNKSDVLAFARASDSDLALVRNVWVKPRSSLLIPLLARMPNAERVAISLSAVRMYGCHGLREKYSVRSVFPSRMATRLREFELTDPQPRYSTSHLFYYEFNAPVFNTVTHLRLGYIDSAHADRLSSPSFYWTNVSVLTHLTHLAFDADPWKEFYLSDIRQYKKILQSPERTALRRLVVVVPPAELEDSDEQTHAEELLALRMPKLVVLVEPLDVTLRRRDWTARTLGKSAFWERVEAFGKSFTA